MSDGREIDAIGQVQAVQYDALRAVQLDKASGVGAYYHYDQVGQLRAEVRYPGGDVIYHAYDARGAQTEALKTGVPDQVWEYDAAGRATHHSQGDANLYYRYDGAGLRTAMALELDGATYWTAYEQDARGLPAALGDA